jgi:hypothetical protein
MDSVEAKHMTLAPEALALSTSDFRGKLPANTMNGTRISAAFPSWAW